MWPYQIITNTPSLHINAELLLVSRMDYTMRILLSPLVLVVNIDDVVPHLYRALMKQGYVQYFVVKKITDKSFSRRNINYFCNSQTECSGRMLMRTFVRFLVC
jgi:hypothetical protein